MAQSPEQMAKTMIGNIKAKTGKSLDQWLKIIDKSKLKKHGEIVKLLKSQYEVTHGFANLIAHKALNKDAPVSSNADLIASQYAGAKSALLPIYNRLIKAIGKFGEDVEVSPKIAYVSLRRNKQFAIVQPSTITRVDVGLNLKDVASTKRLELSGSFNSMVSHRVRITDVSDVNKELIGWLKQAYDRS